MKLHFVRWMSVATVAIAVTGCSKEPDPLGQEGDSCTVDADCDSAFACRESVCVLRAGGADMGNNGGGGDGGTSNGTNNGTPIEDEDFFISYTLRDRNSVDTLWVYDTGNDAHTQVTPDGENCQLGCWVTESLSHYITTQANGPNFDVFAAPLSGSLEPDGAGTMIAQAVRRVEIIGDNVTYVREADGTNTAYTYDVVAGAESVVGVIGVANGTEGDWHIDPVNQQGVVYSPTLQTMDVKIGALGSEITELAYTIDSSNYQETSGSYFGGSIPTAFSRDGNVMALVTQKAPNDYNLCESEADCTGVGQRCGRFGRCSSIEVAVRFFDLNNLDRLGQPCSADDGCGGIQTCDIPAADAVDQAVCVPRRVTLGLPGQQMQNGQTGCALTSGNDDYFYTDVRGPISFDPNGHLYLTAARACGELDIEHTAVVRIDPASGQYEDVYSNEGKDFTPDDCYDPVESAIDVTNCTIWVQRAMLSPGGNELAFVGTNPNVTEPALAQTNVDIWKVKRDGSDHAWVGNHPQTESVRNFNVHPGR